MLEERLERSYGTLGRSEIERDLALLDGSDLVLLDGSDLVLIDEVEKTALWRCHEADGLALAVAERSSAPDEACQQTLRVGWGRALPCCSRTVSSRGRIVLRDLGEGCGTSGAEPASRARHPQHPDSA